DAGDGALSPALDLEPPARSKRACERRPKAVVVVDPMEGGIGENGVDGEVEVEVQNVLAPHARAPAQARGGEIDHVAGGVDREHAAARHELEQPLGDAAGAAADVEDGGVARYVAQALEHVRRPGLLRLADPGVRARVPAAA